MSPGERAAWSINSILSSTGKELCLVKGYLCVPREQNKILLERANPPVLLTQCESSSGGYFVPGCSSFICRETENCHGQHRPLKGLLKKSLFFSVSAQINEINFAVCM